MNTRTKSEQQNDWKRINELAQIMVQSARIVGVAQRDLAAWGALGYAIALSRWDPERSNGAAFWTFAYRSVIGAMLDGAYRERGMQRNGNKSRGACEITYDDRIKHAAVYSDNTRVDDAVLRKSLAVRATMLLESYAGIEGELLRAMYLHDEQAQAFANRRGISAALASKMKKRGLRRLRAQLESAAP